MNKFNWYNDNSNKAFLKPTESKAKQFGNVVLIAGFLILPLIAALIKEYVLK